MKTYLVTRFLDGTFFSLESDRIKANNFIEAQLILIEQQMSGKQHLQSKIVGEFITEIK